MNKVTRILWALLGVLAAYGVIIEGAWWHLGTLGICFIMLATFSEKEIQDGR